MNSKKKALIEKDLLLKNNVFQKANEIKEYVTNLRRIIHKNPEIGMKEFKTTDLIIKELQSYGVELVPINMETGVLGILKGEKKGSETVTAIRADMDALPILEKTGLTYSSENEGVMHACGHDGHTAILLGTAKLLSSMRDKFSGVVKFIFQPGEETLLGAKEMVKVGVLENPKVDNIIALHSDSSLETGKIGTWVGLFHASCDKFTIKIIGRGGHGAKPHQTTDSLLTAAHAVVALQSIISRQLNPLDSAVLSVCSIHGGTAFNIIPEEVEFIGTVRCHNPNIRNLMSGKIENIIKNIAKAFNCKFEYKYILGVPSTKNHPEVIKELTQAAYDSLGEGYVVPLSRPRMGSEDFSFFMENVPTAAMVRLGIKASEEEISAHNNRYNFNDDALPYGIALFVQYILNRNK